MYNTYICKYFICNLYICTKLNIRSYCFSSKSFPYESFWPFTLICNFHLQQWENQLPLPTFHLLNCSVSIYMYSGLRIVHLYPCGKQLSQLKCNSYVQSPLLLILQTTYFQSYLGQHLMPPHLLVRLFHIFLMHLDNFVTLYILS